MNRDIQTLLRKFGRLLTFVAVAVLLTVGLFLAISNIFEIHTIEVKGEGIALVLDEQRIAKNLIFFPSHRIREQLLGDNPLLSDIRFIKKYPQTLIIEPVLRTPVARLSTTDRTVLLDTEGVVLPDAETRVQSMLVFDIKGLHTGQKVEDKRIQQSLRLLQGLAPKETVPLITEREDQSLVAKIGGSDILFTQDNDIPTLLTTLQTILNGVRIKGTLPKIIDLRFDKPIVTF